jgi:hypothetical protein
MFGQGYSEFTVALPNTYNLTFVGMRHAGMRGAGRHIPSSSEIEGGQDLTLGKKVRGGSRPRSRITAYPTP